MISYLSKVQELGPVPFPQFTAERAYMVPFTKHQGLPNDLRRWQPTVDAMLAKVSTDGPIYFMVDQSTVDRGNSHRGHGVHIDGYWIPATNDWGPKWTIGCHSIPGRHGGHRIGDVQGGYPVFATDEAIILASDVEAAQAFEGSWSGTIGEGGDCTGVDLTGLRPVKLRAGLAYAGNVTMLHESLPVQHRVQRTVVRLNVPGWSP